MKCQDCKRTFPISAWIEGDLPSGFLATVHGFKSFKKPHIKVPCCPFCHSISIKEEKTK